MVKKICCAGLVLAVCLSFFACNNSSGWQDKLDNLTNRLEEQDEKFKEQADKIAELEKENENQREALAALEKKIEIERGIFYNGLESAFDKKLLNKEDLMHVSYFQSGTVLEVTEGTGDQWKNEYGSPESEWTVIKRINFVPQIKKPILDTLETACIKQAYYLNNREEFLGDGHGPESSIILGYWGKYNRNYVVEIKADFWEVDTGIPPVKCIGGIIFEEYRFFAVLST